MKNEQKPMSKQASVSRDGSKHMAGSFTLSLNPILFCLLGFVLAWYSSLTLAYTECSPYKGQVFINELRIGSNAKSNVEVYNRSDIAPSVWQTWRLVAYWKEPTKVAQLKGTYNLSSNFTAKGRFIYNSNLKIFTYNRNNYYYDLALVDSNGKLIDYIANEGVIQAVPGCLASSTVFDTTESKNKLGNVARIPDGDAWPTSATLGKTHSIGRSNVCSAGYDLSVSIDASETSPIAGTSPVQYLVTVTNNACSGYAQIKTVEVSVSNVTSALYSGLIFSSVVTGTNPVTWSAGNFSPGVSKTLTINGTPVSTGTLNTTAAITSSDKVLINPADDSDTVSIVARDKNYVGFSISAATLTEGTDTAYSVDIESSLTANNSITVYYTVSGTANTGDTNLPASGSVSIDPSLEDFPTQASINFAITNDSLVEPAKTITFTITSVTSADGAVRLDSAAQTMTITLLDDDVILAANYSFDDTWSSSDNLADSSGNNKHASLSGSVAQEAAPALGLKPDTCRAGNFGQSGWFATPSGLDVDTTSGGKNSVAFWMYWDGGFHSSNFTMPFSWGGTYYDLTLSKYIAAMGNGVIGFNTGNGDVYGVTASGLANGWHHVVAVFNNGDVTQNQLYIDGVAKTLMSYGSQSQRSATNTAGIGAGSGWGGDYKWSGKLDQLYIFRGALSASDVATGYANELAGKNWDGSAPTCAVISTGPAALNAVDVGANAVNGKITTKTAGSTFNLDIYALNAARTAQDTAASGAILLDLLVNATTSVTLDVNNCPSTATSLSVGTVTLAAGKVTTALGSVADSWRDVRVRMRYPATGTATVTACSSDNFAVKPAALSAIASHADWQTAGLTTTIANSGATGGEVHKAGRPFSLRVTGYNASNVITGNYAGSPTATSSCVLPASGCVAGTLSAGSFSASGGTATSSTASYSEVGAISATFTDTGYASVDSADTAASCAGYYVCASPINIGRFVPDHYDVATLQTPQFQTFGSTCGSRSFTYVGQDFGFATLPRARVTAKNFAGGSTTNYTGALWRLNPNGGFASSWRCYKSDGSACGNISLSAAGFSASNLVDNGNGSADFTWPSNFMIPNGVNYQFQRTAPPTAPFNAQIGLGILVMDRTETGNCGLASCTILDSQTANVLTWGSNIAFDAGNQFYQGRLRLANASGSELRFLPMPLSAQFWNGQGFVTNTADNCSALTAPSLTFYSQTANNQLTSGETTASVNATLVAGSGNLRLSAPGAGNFGYLDVTVTAPAWLQYNWDGVDQLSDGNLFDDNPHARAAFGKRRGSDHVIIRREIY